jgi:hypothetical protein
MLVHNSLPHETFSLVFLGYRQFWMGRELNPQLGGLDLKVFGDLSPSLIGWVVLNISMACEQAARRGAITDSMALVLLFQGWYVFDALYYEVSES